MALPSRCVSSPGTGSGWTYSLAWKLGFSSHPFLEVIPGRLCSGPAGLLLVTPFLQGHRGLVPATILSIHMLAETLVVHFKWASKLQKFKHGVGEFSLLKGRAQYEMA